jgi:hypothetical protein
MLIAAVCDRSVGVGQLGGGETHDRNDKGRIMMGRKGSGAPAHATDPEELEELYIGLGAHGRKGIDR